MTRPSRARAKPYWANCRDQIKKNLKPKFNLDIEVKYLWEMVADALILEEQELGKPE